MSTLVAVTADLLVAVLLVATILTSVRLSRRMAGLKADESVMRTTIRELVLATETAERAIGALRQAAQESERTLGERLGAASRQSARLAEQVDAGEAVLDRVTQVAGLSRRGPDARAQEGQNPAPAPDRGLRATILAAREVALRSADRLGERAA